MIISEHRLRDDELVDYYHQNKEKIHILFAKFQINEDEIEPMILACKVIDELEL